MLIFHIWSILHYEYTKKYQFRQVAPDTTAFELGTTALVLTIKAALNWNLMILSWFYGMKPIIQKQQSKVCFLFIKTHLLNTF